MRACVVHAAKDLRVETLPPPEPAPGHVVVEIAYGGICGSDLHYYHRGAVGDFTVVEPLVLGHEVSGRVATVGDGVSSVTVGQSIVVHPATPCGSCPECLDGRRNVCRDTRYLGSAARVPHVQGGFSQLLAVPADQVVPLPAGLDLKRATLAEPLAVALHAVARAGDVSGRRVLVTGAGPIGALAVAALRDAGAAEVVVSDLAPHALEIAAAVGATSVLSADREDGWPAEVDLAIEASGAAPALARCVTTVARGGRVVQLGLLPPGQTPILGNLLVTREIELVGSFRFDSEITDAVHLLARGLPVDPILSHVLPLARSREAFDLAGDRSRASKVLLDLAG